MQFESGYPYIMFEDAVNYYNTSPNVGRISQSNLCSEILQPQTRSQFGSNGEFDRIGRDVACNLGSLNVDHMLSLENEDEFEQTVTDAIEFLTNVSRFGDFSCSPTIQRGNASAHSIGLGQMNLHGALIKRGLSYASEEAQDLWRVYIQRVTYYAIKASNNLAKETGTVYDGFAGSDWENGKVFDRIVNDVAQHEERAKSLLEWAQLRDEVAEYGMFNQNLQAIPPTGSISYINFATSSIHPITSKIEIRKEGKIGRVYSPAYGLTNENFKEVETAYELGPNPVIDMYAVSTPYVDQGQSLTLFFNSTATTRDLNRAQNYAHKKGIKTLYYVRLQQAAIEGTNVDECVSCML